ncbi:MAG: hypothetical protein J0G29_03435 [Alphaproteobacteria bacterium]|mgnify:CR=1 FL=1|nr:hypothetical protein [Alphaproteobacteria bacterium]OJV45286.1 MAG: hypothetical protein BGO28_00695 [Alphaproteobacteria bacterium 43-37]
MGKNVYIWFFLLALQACAVSSGKLLPQDRVQEAEQIAQAAGFKRYVIPSSPNKIWSYLSPAWGQPDLAASEATVYIEGDGVLETPSRAGAFLSRDPTPTPPLPLLLAADHHRLKPNHLVAYIARPCQFTLQTKQDKCESLDWLKERYGDKALASLSNALDILKAKQAISGFRLVGYSGGGTFALRLARTRTDVTSVATLAANLDHGVFFGRHFETHPPAPFDLVSGGIDLNRLVKEEHMVGGSDQIVFPEIAQTYLRKMKQMSPMAPVTVNVVPGLTHHDYEHWRKLWLKVLLAQ